MAAKSCPIKVKGPDLTGVEVIELRPGDECDHGQAKLLSDAEAAGRYEEYMLVSWYDRERDLESPPHATEGPEGGPTDGYIHYALSHVARPSKSMSETAASFSSTPRWSGEAGSFR